VVVASSLSIHDRQGGQARPFSLTRNRLRFRAGEKLHISGDSLIHSQAWVENRLVRFPATHGDNRPSSDFWPPGWEGISALRTHMTAAQQMAADSARLLV